MEIGHKEVMEELKGLLEHAQEGFNLIQRALDNNKKDFIILTSRVVLRKSKSSLLNTNTMIDFNNDIIAITNDENLASLQPELIKAKEQFQKNISFAESVLVEWEV